MLLIGTHAEAHEKVWADTQRLLAHIQSLSAMRFADIHEGIALLRRLREETYEDLNQIQHEHMILRASEWLIREGRCSGGTEWSWNPRQTGDETEPDLRGHCDGSIVVSAEVTTSRRPDGIIDTRMAKTLRKLSQMDGSKFYFVQTDAMAMRATTKVRKCGFSIEVVKLSATFNG